ncbi:Trans-L-3-hydroxyproline dehydratase [Acropora cervicornis]|uniref:trans-L-3-hydroxyproline dehydratase n=1 Tax=Acropora cervicornis TaxID=6130 RepID=A0AAD9V9J3_ACRCE|nr:Trans-L-3-hydroxyproline dehydratase [Acropora cervicornis]
MEDNGLEISTVEMHTGGEPLRIIISGYPEIKGDTILAKRRYLRENLDHIRKLMMYEPRGHYDMYGAVIVPPGSEMADLGVIFMHNEGYSTMCGHAVIALGRYAVDSGLLSTDVSRSSVGEVPVFIECPCGVVKALVNIEEGKSGRVRFTSVPAFAFGLDLEVDTEKFGKIKVDIGFGGAFYVLVSGERLGVDVRSTRVNEIVEVANIISTAAKSQIKVHHPDSEDLAFLYGTIITDGNDMFNGNLQQPTANICVFADNQVDRSPCGSGVAARIAVQYARKQIGMHQTRVFENGLVGSKFTGQAVKETKCGEFDAVHVEVAGSAHYIGKCSFTVEKEDPFKQGFLLK